MKIPFTDMEFVMLDSFKDTSRFIGLLSLGGSATLFIQHKNIIDGFTLLFMSLMFIGMSYCVPTVSLFEYWKLKKEGDLKDLEEMKKEMRK